jgi:hypothetical protein
VSGFSPQHLASTVWAYATAGVRADALYAALAEAAMRNGVGSFTPQELANTVWAYAKAGVRAPALFAAVAEAAVRTRLRGFKPQELSSTVWAFACVRACLVAVRSGHGGGGPQQAERLRRPGSRQHGVGIRDCWCARRCDVCCGGGGGVA